MYNVRNTFKPYLYLSEWISLLAIGLKHGLSQVIIYKIYHYVNINMVVD